MNMKRAYLITLMLCTLLPGMSRAQGTTDELDTDYGARFSVSAEKKIVKGFHWTLDGEARLSDNLGYFGRWQAGTGMTWKAAPWLKLGAGFILIEKMNSEDEWKQRHRFYGDATFSLSSGAWKFSLKERLQLTHREVGNTFQANPNSLAMKSRFKVSYKATSTLSPYGYVELRNVFNDPACSATWSTASLAYSDYSFLGYTDAYFNRVRGSLGVDWKLDKHNSLDIFILTDYCYDKVIDTNAKGTKLKSLIYDQSLKPAIGLGYKLSF